MEEIPEDVWQAANMAVANAPEYTEQLHKDVAGAILSERERCAKVAEARVSLYSTTGANGQLVCSEIASSIRSSPAHDH